MTHCPITNVEFFLNIHEFKNSLKFRSRSVHM